MYIAIVSGLNLMADIVYRNTCQWVAIYLHDCMPTRVHNNFLQITLRILLKFWNGRHLLATWSVGRIPSNLSPHSWILMMW